MTQPPHPPTTVSSCYKVPVIQRKFRHLSISYVPRSRDSPRNVQKRKGACKIEFLVPQTLNPPSPVPTVVLKESARWNFGSGFRHAGTDPSSARSQLCGRWWPGLASPAYGHASEMKTIKAASERNRRSRARPAKPFPHVTVSAVVVVESLQRLS